MIENFVQIAQWDLALERDAETEAEDPAMKDLPPQLLFIHQGLKDVKEIHWHRKVSGLMIATSHTGLQCSSSSSSTTPRVTLTACRSSWTATSPDHTWLTSVALRKGSLASVHPLLSQREGDGHSETFLFWSKPQETEVRSFYIQFNFSLS